MQILFIVINIDVEDSYFVAFRTVVKETQEKHGFELPVDLETYITFLLADRIDAYEIVPKRTFMESYLRIKDPRSAKDLGDTCLFLTGVFPEYGNRYGFTIDYYSSIGKDSYSNASYHLNRELFFKLSRHFEFLRNFITLATRDKKQP